MPETNILPKGFDKVRVRIAPSPTGDPHVGLAYITLFNYVFAKINGGDLVLRIEDTDQTRAKASSEQLIMSSLKWLGLRWDEGPDVSGPFGPYRQSERADIHKKHAELLVEKGAAYCCFCTSERLDKMREAQKAAGQMSQYDRHCRNLNETEIKSLKDQKIPFVIRLKMPTDGAITFEDALRGTISIEAKQLDDQVLLKSDGFPTYHLANVVDDHLMKISHVMRAEEWLSSTPKHVVLYECFGWEKPVFIHMPLLRNNDKSKISKRKNPTSLEYYRRAGILPKAMINFLGLMGWSFSDSQEIFSLEDMMSKFKIKEIHLGGPVFDLTKLSWVNHHYMKQMTDHEFSQHIREQIFSEDYIIKMKPLIIERMQRFEQFVDNNDFFFNGALSYDFKKVMPEGIEKNEVKNMLKGLLEILDEQYHWDDAHLKETLDQYKEQAKWKPKDFFMLIRNIVTGRTDSPPLVESMTIIGREMVRHRIRDFLKQMNEQKGMK